MTHLILLSGSQFPYRVFNMSSLQPDAPAKEHHANRRVPSLALQAAMRTYPIPDQNFYAGRRLLNRTRIGIL
jgi:hypothetical protein